MNGDGSPNVSLSQESIPLFQEGIFLILSRWSALCLAVDNEWGGRNSRHLADKIASNIFTWFTQPRNEPLYIDDLEQILDDGLDSFNTMAEDGSVEEVAEKLMIMHEECLLGNYQTIERLRQAGPGAGPHQHIRLAANDDEDDNDDGEDDDGMGVSGSDMAIDAPKSQPIPNQVNKQVNQPSCQDVQDEDGWTTVSSKKNRGKRN